MQTPVKNIPLTTTQKHEVAQRRRALVAALAEGRKGTARPLALKAFLKQARKRFPHLVG